MGSMRRVQLTSLDVGRCDVSDPRVFGREDFVAINAGLNVQQTSASAKECEPKADCVNTELSWARKCTH